MREETACALVVPEGIVRRERMLEPWALLVLNTFVLAGAALWLSLWFPASNPWVWLAAATLLAAFGFAVPGMISHANMRAAQATVVRCCDGTTIEASRDPLLPYTENTTVTEQFVLHLSATELFSWQALGEQPQFGYTPEGRERPPVVLAFAFFAHEESSSGRLVPVRIECRHATHARVVQMLEAIRKVHAKTLVTRSPSSIT